MQEKTRYSTQEVVAPAISAVFFQEEDGTWVAQCLEFDIAAQAKSVPELDYELQRVLFAHIAISVELNQRPFLGLNPAPQKYWDMFERGMRLESRERPFRLPESIPLPYMIPRLKIAEQHAR